MIKLDATVLHFLRSVFRRSQDTLMCQDLRDTVAGFLRHAAHNKYHGQHHHGREDLNAVADQGGKFTGRERCSAGSDDELRSKEAY